MDLSTLKLLIITINLDKYFRETLLVQLLWKMKIKSQLYKKCRNQIY